jgi:ATP-dependent DNA ligase
MSIYKILEEVAATASKNEKEAILRKYKQNEVLKAFFVNALSPMVRFHVKKIPTYKPESNRKAQELSLSLAMVAVLPKLAQRQVTGHAAIALLKSTLESLTEWDALVLERIIKKDPRIGAQTNTVNKVWPKLIPEFPCMLATANDEKILAKFKFPALAQCKMDGMRFNAIVKNGIVEYRSRNGKELDILGALDNTFGDMALAFDGQFAGAKDVVFDGELVVVDAKGNILPRKVGNGILNKAQKGTLSQEESFRIRATIWDAIPFTNWETGVWGVPYHARLRVLQAIAFGAVSVVETTRVHDLTGAQIVFEDYLAKGQEGIILKEENMPWEDTRSKSQIKFKAEKECDLLCTGWVEGRKGTKNEGLLGALACESLQGIIKVNVGGGLSDKQRRELKPEDVVGKIIAVLYNEKIMDESGNWSLFLPRFVEIREDKDEADAFEDVK